MKEFKIPELFTFSELEILNFIDKNNGISLDVIIEHSELGLFYERVYLSIKKEKQKKSTYIETYMSGYKNPLLLSHYSTDGGECRLSFNTKDNTEDHNQVDGGVIDYQKQGEPYLKAKTIRFGEGGVSIMFPVTKHNIQKFIIKNNQTNYMKTLKNTIKNLMRKEPEKTFIEVGFLDQDENITEKGREALEIILFEKYETELKALADKLVTKEE